MFSREPECVLSRQALTDRGGSQSDLGITDPPNDGTTQAPRFRIDVEQTLGGQWQASVVMEMGGAEGTNRSAYLGEGVYSTGLMYVGEALTYYTPGDGNREIYMVVTDAVAWLNREAEREHCRDIIQAYNLTVGQADMAIRRSSNGACPAADSREQAIVNAQTRLLSFVTLAQLRPVFSANIRSDGTDPVLDAGSFETQLLALFNSVNQRTSLRDSVGWHFFRPGRRVSPADWGQPNDPTRDLRITALGAEFRVPGEPSVALMTPPFPG